MTELAPDPSRRNILREQCYICWMTATGAPPPAGKTEAEIRSAHFAYLVDLERQGVLFAAGPFVDEAAARHGAGMMIVRAKTKAEADALAQAEPFTAAGMRTMTLTPWQRNEGTLNLSIRFSDGIMQVDGRTYALVPPQA